MEKEKDISPITFYDYENQAWVKNDHYIRCGHPENMLCGCYGKIHEGEKYQGENE